MSVQEMISPEQQPIHDSVTAQQPSTPANSTSDILQGTNDDAIWQVPRRNPFFTGREQLLNQLHTNLSTSKATALTQAQAVNGLGGIGKTQVAIEYAYRYRGEYHNVFWFNAASRETLFSDFATIATSLHLPVSDERDLESIMKKVNEWVAQHTGCLLIFDNADDLPVLEEFLPTDNVCHIIITTREQGAGPYAQSLDVQHMDTDEGIHMLLRRAGILAPDSSIEQVAQEKRAVAKQIVQEMGGLPLALDQAGAYIDATKCSLVAYLTYYTNRQAEFFARRGRHALQHADPVATTWSLSFERVEQRNPLAADLMRCCAFLAPDDIPEEFFTKATHELSPLLQPIAADPSLLDDAIGELLRFSLVRRNPDNNTISIHRLVQAILRITMDKETQKLWAERTVRMVNDVFPGGNIDVAAWKQCQRYISHAQSCANFIEHYHLAFPEAAHLLNQAAYYLQHALALYIEAESLFKLALDIREQVLGPEHPYTATSLNNLALLYKSQGKYEQAESLYQRALRIREQVLGPEHPDTAQCLNNLAGLYRSQGKYEQAEQLLEQALRIKEQVLGPEHPDTAQSLNNLAAFYNDQGKYEQAEPLLERALRIREQVLGSVHPNTATSLNNLAFLYDSQGKYEQAEPLYQRALHIREQVLGSEHPDTAISLNNLAWLYEGQGKYEQAEWLYQRAMHIYEKVLGPEHSTTKIIRANYIRLLESMKQKKQ